MKFTTFTILLALHALVSHSTLADTTESVAIALHGGAGTISRAQLTPEQDKAYRNALSEAATKGYQWLQDGVPGEQVVVKVIQLMEESTLFNAGRGAVYTFDGSHELDASIMHGKDKQAGAVSGVKHIKSPIEAAQLVMRESVHVMLSGQGAESFAFDKGLARVDNSYFNTQRRLEALQKAKQKIEINASAFYRDPKNADYKFGTVGVVVLDAAGDLVAGTSTGGMTAKRFGRIGDSPIIGAGTYADNESCAVSATGHGEYFIRYNVAADICARMKYQNISLEKAADAVINQVLAPIGGDGGVVAIDHQGNIAMPFNTPGMYRASVALDGSLSVHIYRDE